MTPVLEIENLHTEIDGNGAPTRAVDGISLDIRRGETFALVGESGCGKSMTALSVMRLLPEAGRITSGAVRINGDDLLSLPEAAMRDVRGRRIAMIFQEPATSLNAVMTVGRQIEEVLERHLGLSGDAARARAISLLDAVGVPDARRRVGEYPFQLSGGLKQRVMIAMALAAEPEVLVADEPTTALDVTIQAQVLDLLKKLQTERGMAILLITHDLGIVAGMAQRVAVMYAGEIVEVATREAFFSNPQHPYSRKLFQSLPGAARRGSELAVIPGQVPPLNSVFHGCRFADRCEFVHARCREESPDWTALGTEHKVRCHWVEENRVEENRVESNIAGSKAEGRGGADSTDGGGGVSAAATLPGSQSPAHGLDGTLLDVRDMKVHFPIRKGLFKRVVAHVKAVDGVSLEVAAGKTLALVGESGCGKTTVGKAILQLIRPSAGEVVFDQVDLTQLHGEALRLRRREFQIIFQDPYASLNPRMRIMDILSEGMSALGLGAGGSSQQQRLNELLDQVGLPQSALSRYPHEFSGGQRQRIAIARALAVEPRLIICDEPTSALDVSVQAQILNLLARLQRELGLAYLFITHNIAVVEYLAHEVAVMYLGRIVERGSAGEVLNSPQHPYTQALLSAVPSIEAGSGREVIKLEGELPSPVNPPSGCHFHPRCRQALPECRVTFPAVAQISPTHQVACWLHTKKV